MKKNLVKVNVNSKNYEMEEGVPLLQALWDADVPVPHFCYHPGIGVEGSCRLCMVEIEGARKLETSCTIPVKEGMVVRTQSEQVVKARKGVLEFILLNHPLDCPFCDKGGECPLQNYTIDSRQNESRFEFEKRSLQKHKPIGEHIYLDQERCVLCNRCVRFLRDHTGREEMGIRNRGSHSEIFAAQELTTGYTGNLQDICPVGALTTKDFRFKARPWELKRTDSICGECSLGCSNQLWRKGGEVLRMTPRIEGAVNEWWLCDRGRFSRKDYLDGDRLQKPILTSNGKDLSPEDVLKEMVEKMRKVPEGSMAFVADDKMTNEEFLFLRKMAKKGKSGRVFIPTRESVLKTLQEAASRNLEAEFPKGLEGASLALVLGEDLEKTHPVLKLRLRRQCKVEGLALATAGTGEMGLSDIANEAKLSENEVHGFIKALAGFIENGSIPSDDHSSFWKALRSAEKIQIFFGDSWIKGETEKDCLALLDALNRNGSEKFKLNFLIEGSNLRGMIDQADEGVATLDILESEIRAGRIEGLFWLGKASDTDVFKEYAKGMRVFGQGVLRREDAHTHAQYVFPIDSFYEKSGTFTNTFGRVQRVRKATRKVEKGFLLVETLGMVNEFLGLDVERDMEKVFSELASEAGSYPGRRSEISESTSTYAHYERAVWRS